MCMSCERAAAAPWSLARAAQVSHSARLTADMSVQVLTCEREDERPRRVRADSRADSLGVYIARAAGSWRGECACVRGSACPVLAPARLRKFENTGDRLRFTVPDGGRKYSIRSAHGTAQATGPNFLVSAHARVLVRQGGGRNGFLQFWVSVYQGGRSEGILGHEVQLEVPLSCSSPQIKL